MSDEPKAEQIYEDFAAAHRGDRIGTLVVKDDVMPAVEDALKALPCARVRVNPATATRTPLVE